VTVRDVLGGALFFVIGAAIAIWSRITLSLGTFDQMGPGFFPLCLGIILAVIGIAIAVRPVRAALPLIAGRPEWRGWLCIIGSVIAFLVLGRFLGLVAATFAIVFIAALGDRKNSVRDAFLLSAAMCVVCVVVFSWALQIQFPLWRFG
jgi:hypothetical protein